VDVIFRRLDDDFWRSGGAASDSFLGVPGLVHAVRGGTSPWQRPGKRAAGNAGLAGGSCRPVPAFPGRELLLPSVPTWWCGEPRALEHVLAHLPDMVIKPAFASMRRELIITSPAERGQRRALAAQIRARPRNFVGQDRLLLSTTPILAGPRLEPRQMVMRIYTWPPGMDSPSSSCRAG